MILVTLMILVVISSTASGVHARELTTSEKALAFMNDVAGFEVAAYTSTLRSSKQESFLTQTKEVVDYTLFSGDSGCRAMVTFVSGKLQQVFMSNYTGRPKLSESPNTLEDAKIFMEKYAAYAVTTDCSTMLSLLNSVQREENVTKISGNTKLIVSTANKSSIQYSWTYVDDNGIPAPSKTVFLSYRNGLLKCFQNNWQFFSIDSHPKLSEETAVNIAVNAIAMYSTTVLMPDNTTKPVSGFKVQSIGQTALSYQNFRETDSARNGDPFTLYPTWVVPLGFDKVYEGSISCANVRLWADTGVVSNISPITVGNSDASVAWLESVDQPASPTAYSALLVFVAFCCVALLCRSWSKARIEKRRLSKTTALLLCLCIVVYTSSVAFPNAKADKVSHLYGSTYGQLEAEWYDVEYLSELFDNAGYSVGDYAGSYTTKQNILYYEDQAEDNYDFVAVFHFGHMNGANHYFDNDGYDVSYSDIDQVTTQGKHYFVFLWTCMQDDIMGSAWTQDLDDGDHCFLAFDGASPTMAGMGLLYWGTYGFDIVNYFYWYALAYGYSVEDALDCMCGDLFSCNFYYSPLCGGFYSYWAPNPVFPSPPGPAPGWYAGQMIVYGNSDIYLT